jgi:hypothetical protein
MGSLELFAHAGLEPPPLASWVARNIGISHVPSSSFTLKEKAWCFYSLPSLNSVWLFFLIFFYSHWAPVVHIYNPSFLRGWGQEDQGEASLDKYFARPYLGKPFTKKGLVEWLKV